MDQKESYPGTKREAKSKAIEEHCLRIPLRQKQLKQGRHRPYFKGEVEEDEICSFFLFEDLEIIVQSAVLINPAKEEARGSGRAVHSAPPRSLPPAPALLYLDGLTLGAATARAVSIVLLACREDHQPLVHAASLNIKPAWPKQRQHWCLEGVRARGFV